MTSGNCDLSTAYPKENIPIRMNNASSAACLEKASYGVHKSQNKKGFGSLIPRYSLGVSSSFNNALRTDFIKKKGRLSMIPKSKSVKRTEKGNVKIEPSTQSEEISTFGKFSNKAEAESSEPKGLATRQDSQPELKIENARETETKEGSEDLDAEISTTSLKSCMTTIDLKHEQLKRLDNSTMSMKSRISEYTDAEEDLDRSITSDEIFGKGAEDEKEAQRQERGIRALYETLKSTGPTFDNFKWICEKNQEDHAGDWENFSVQKCYDVTLEEISDIWKNTMSLISSVKDHAIRFIEEKEEANSLDREQLILESEMVQLAVDFAINYSKLKTDYLIKFVGERLGVENLMKTFLEEIMDSKPILAMYNEEDLGTMSQTIKDLNANVLKEEHLRGRVQTCRNFTNPFSRWCL